MAGLNSVLSYFLHTPTGQLSQLNSIAFCFLIHDLATPDPSTCTVISSFVGRAFHLLPAGSRPGCTCRRCHGRRGRRRRRGLRKGACCISHRRGRRHSPRTAARPIRASPHESVFDGLRRYTAFHGAPVLHHLRRASFTWARCGLRCSITSPQSLAAAASSCVSRTPTG